MKSATLILSLICIICAILLPIYAICIGVKEGYSFGIIFYMTTIASCMSGGVIYSVYKMIKEEYF